MKVALYARVSTKKDQTVENQLLALRDWAEGRGHTIAGEYVDEGISGKKGRDKRPGLDAMEKAATRGEFEMIAVTALDRLGRSLPHLVGLVAELEALGVGLFVRNLALDTSTPAGRLMFNVMGSLAEFERELIRERTMLGLERARRQGKTLGRPKVPGATERRIHALLESGVPINKIMRLTRVGASTIYRIKKELAACPSNQ
ncbi:recombinase family protein [uncultured Alcanivorax sp.]|jgi:DNA invertase Pin-like site-specific DNA recombinase|uniref:recombinase family protein n=1 Tax=uncultured Alcanivorax sp. TaxID=191215 RepID=UPI0025D59CAF|nr:recombinase family protein [uncultured Alcanivorax sp.]